MTGQSNRGVDTDFSNGIDLLDIRSPDHRQSPRRRSIIEIVVENLSYLHHLGLLKPNTSLLWLSLL